MSLPCHRKTSEAESGEMHWGDETALVNTDAAAPKGSSYALRGQTLVTRAVGGTAHKRSMVSTLTNQGKSSWMNIEDSFNADRLIEFLGALASNAQSS